MSVTFNCTFEEQSKLLSVTLEKKPQLLPITFGVIHEVMPDNIEIYEGGYAITPTVDGQVLQTAQKLMKDDVTIKAIPFYDVSNTSGGKTIYIGDSI